jgi:hypothetical protein
MAAVLGYVLLLSFPQVLFAHQISYRNLMVYSRTPLDQNVYAVLDKVESRLATSEINNQEKRSTGASPVFLRPKHSLQLGPR